MRAVCRAVVVVGAVVLAGCAGMSRTEARRVAPSGLAELGCDVAEENRAPAAPDLERLAGRFSLATFDSLLGHVASDDTLFLGWDEASIPWSTDVAREHRFPEEALLVGWRSTPGGTGLTPAHFSAGNRLVLDLNRKVTSQGVALVMHTSPAMFSVEYVFEDGFAGTWVQPFDHVMPVDSSGRVIGEAIGLFCARRVE